MKTVNPATFRLIYEAILSGLEDYTTDQRGDVGSWVRGTALASLAPLLRVACQVERSDLVTQGDIDAAIAGVLKQGVEKLDNIREASGKALENVVNASAGRWTLQGADSIMAILPS